MGRGQSKASGGSGEAFRWTAETGMIGLSDLPGSLFQSDARGVSADGAVVTGSGVSDAGQFAFRWTEATGLVSLGALPAFQPGSHGQGISGDGTTVVGFCSSFDSPGGEPCRWTAATGMLSLGTLPGAPPGGQATATNFDGSVVVGNSELPGHVSSEPFRWSQETGMVGLGHLPGVTIPSGLAFAVSNDGNTVVGQAGGSHGLEAFRWTAETGMIGLGDLPGGIFRSVANGISGDGTIIVGNASIDGPPGFPDPYQAAFIWDATHGMRRLIDVLASDYGLALAGWQIVSANAISNDGLAIVGGAQPPQGPVVAYEVLLPEPASASLLALATLLFRCRARTT
ncbi:MAG: PEP-CTERM sorting domain-containing protein [Phycisphaerae bacterium]